MRRLLPLLALAACDTDLATWEGEGAFPVRAAWMASCTGPQGTHTFAVAISGRNCADHVEVEDVVPADPCGALRDMLAETCDPDARLGSSATHALALWFEGSGLDELKNGVSTSSATLFRCKSRKSGVWTGDATELQGSFEVVEVVDGIATVEVDAGRLKGTVPFEVCR